MDKIKAFFSNKWVKLISWVVLGISAAFLIIGGATAESISSGVALVGGIITAVSLLIAFISSQIK